MARREKIQTIDEMLAQQEAEYAARDEKLGPVGRPETAREAAFLEKWSKGRPIRRIHSAADLCGCGGRATKVSRRMAEALIREGFATGTRDAFTVGGR